MPSRSEGESRRPITSASSETPTDRKLLDEVLQHTQSIASNEEPLDLTELAALKEVAQRHRGRSLGTVIVLELVQAIFSLRWSKTIDSPTVLAAMAKQAADTIIESPASNERMQNLWNRLCEVES